MSSSPDSPSSSRSPLCQSHGEELANSITHGLGIPLSIAGLVILVVQAVKHSPWHVVGVSVFGASMILLYMASCIYHAIYAHRPKRVLQVLDHAFIFVLIAGTYTPFVLVNLRGTSGWWLFGIVWGLAIAGIVMKVFLLPRFEKVSSLIYLAMGWLVCTVIAEVIAKVPHMGVVWLVIGGVCYTVGVIFFVMPKVRFAHAIWHLFVLAGSISHFFAVLYGVVPSV